MIAKHLLVLKHLKITLYAKSMFLIACTLAEEGLLLPGAQLILGYARNIACSGKKENGRQNVRLLLPKALSSP